MVYDREASFPFENFADFRDAGLLAVCVPARTADSGATYADYVRVSEEVGRYCGATALTFNMHNATMLWCGEVADLLDMSPADARSPRADPRAMFARRRRATATSTASRSRRDWRRGRRPAWRRRRCRSRAAGSSPGARSSRRCRGAATFYNVTCQVPGEDEIRLLGVPATPTGVSRSSTTGIRSACAARCRARC